MQNEKLCSKKNVATSNMVLYMKGNNDGDEIVCRPHFYLYNFRIIIVKCRKPSTKGDPHSSPYKLENA